MKKIISILMTLALMATMLFAFTSCSDDKDIIGIMQFGSHESLNNCKEGIIQGLEERGITEENYTIEVLNSNFDMVTAQNQAEKLVNKGVKVIIAIATPSAIQAATAALGKDIPVVYCAVTDKATMEGYSNVTGASDVPNFDKQLELVTAFMGKENLKIGVLYSTSESSSPYQVELLKEAAKKYNGMEIKVKAVADITAIDTYTNSLVDEGVDCFVNLLDNTIVGKLSNILAITDAKKIPVFGSEIEQVKVGCAASASIEYITVGKLAGLAAAQILLDGKSASDIPVQTITEPNNYYNSEVCSELGLSLPTSVSAKDVIEK
ncbi:MAG: ABC transporter substrate-binding protein [Clostridia bacterium]|nr:ABC transporter substrate-binding protein [Clostridia bacterium]